MDLSTPEKALREARQIKPRLGQVVYVQGTYHAMLDYSKTPPASSTRVEILLTDGFGLALGKGKEGIRSKKEHNKFIGRSVLVQARLQHNCLLATEGYFSSFSMDCLTEVETIMANKRPH